VRAWTRGLLALLLTPIVVHADMSFLGVSGPSSGLGIANIGAVTNTDPATALSKATVVITLGAGKGENLTASCLAEFDLQTGATPNNKPMETLVAFPVTGMYGDAVKVDQFAVVIDKTHKPVVLKGWIGLSRAKPGDPITFMLGAPVSEFASSGFSESEVRNKCSKFYKAFLWNETFLPGSQCHVKVSYVLELRPQSLAYAKSQMHSQNPDLVPFDAMVAGESQERAYFLDYILRSGATWSGPIGRETITLRTDDTLTFAESGAVIFGDPSGLPLPGEIFAVQRKYFPDGRDDFDEGLEYLRAGIDLYGFKSIRGGMVWEVDHQKPTSDILLEIPLRAIRRLKPQ